MAAEKLIGFRERMKAKGKSIRGSDNWNKTTPLSQWHGVTTNNSGDIVGLDLSCKWLDAVNYARETVSTVSETVDMCIGCCSGYIYAVVYDAVVCVCSL